MDSSYVHKIRDWVVLDNEILRQKETVQDAIDKKKVIEEDILQYVEENQFENLTLTISDGSIKFGKKSMTQPLSIKTLKILLEKYAVSHQISINVNDICQYITQNLEKKNSIYMKRELK
jgi:hypothetical protein